MPFSTGVTEYTDDTRDEQLVGLARPRMLIYIGCALFRCCTGRLASWSLLASYDGWLWNGWRGPRRINHWRLSSWGKEDFLLVRFLPFRFLLTRKMTERQVDGKCRPPVFCRTANAPNQQKEKRKRETSSVTDVFLIFPIPTTLSFDSRSLFFKSMPVDQ